MCEPQGVFILSADPAQIVPSIATTLISLLLCGFRQETRSDGAAAAGGLQSSRLSVSGNLIPAIQAIKTRESSAVYRQKHKREVSVNDVAAAILCWWCYFWCWWCLFSHSPIFWTALKCFYYFKTLCGGPDKGCLCTEEGWGPEAATEDIQPVEFSDFYLSLGNSFDVSLICLQGRRTKLHAIHMSASVHSLLQSFIVTKVHSCDKLLSWDNNTEGYCLSSQHLYIQSQQDFIPFFPLLGHVLIW